MRKKIFILGVGTQKAGTTWLHSQLAKCENVDMGFAKEYHVFDVIYSEYCKTFRNQLLDGMSERIGNGLTDQAKDPNMSKRFSFVDNTDNYFDYFDYLHAKNSDIEAVGDITPSYSMLSANAFSHIKRGLEKRGFSVKVVFLMRDPVERIWSMLRMKRRVLMAKADGVATQFDECSELRKIYKAPASKLRTSYERTIVELESVFSRKEVHYGFYENLFQEDSFNSLQNFLELELDKPDFDFKPNVSAKTGTIDPSLNKEIVNFHAETYIHIREKFGKLPTELWQGYDHISDGKANIKSPKLLATMGE